VPIYEFECKKCDVVYEELTSYDKTEKYKGVECPDCGSKSKRKLVSGCGISFGNPKESSKWDSRSYRAGHNHERAKGERRHAEAASHMGTNPYGGAGDNLNVHGSEHIEL
jgi:putative FmdB family regulatory protein